MHILCLEPSPSHYVALSSHLEVCAIHFACTIDPVDIPRLVDPATITEVLTTMGVQA